MIRGIERRADPRPVACLPTAQHRGKASYKGVNIAMTIMKKAALRSTTFLSLITIFASTSAIAQETANPETADEADSIVVTGSRIARPEFSNPNPIQVLDAATIEETGRTNLTETLATNPALLGSTRSIDTAGSNLLNAQQVGVNFLDLRNLGSSRTLVWSTASATSRARRAPQRSTSTRSRPTWSSVSTCLLAVFPPFTVPTASPAWSTSS